MEESYPPTPQKKHFHYYYYYFYHHHHHQSLHSIIIIIITFTIIIIINERGRMLMIHIVLTCEITSSLAKTNFAYLEETHVSYRSDTCLLSLAAPFEVICLDVRIIQSSVNISIHNIYYLIHPHPRFAVYITTKHPNVYC